MLKIYSKKPIQPLQGVGKQQNKWGSLSWPINSLQVLPEFKMKVAGNEGDLEKLLTKARFQDAELQDLHPQTAQLPIAPSQTNNSTSNPTSNSSKEDTGSCPRNCRDSLPGSVLTVALGGTWHINVLIVAVLGPLSRVLRVHLTNILMTMLLLLCLRSNSPRSSSLKRKETLSRRE